MFPTIYGLGLTGVGDDTKLGGSGIIMGIAGGAVFPFIQAYLIDNFASNRAGYIVQIFCFGLITVYALYARRFEKKLEDTIV